MLAYDFNFRFLLPYAESFLAGTIITILMSVLSFVLGSTAGVPLGILLRIPSVSKVLLVVNDAIRAIPVLVLILLVYYFPFPQLIGVPHLSAFWAATIAIGISQASYTADIVRASIDGVPPRLWDSGRSIGLSNRQIWIILVLPEVFRQISAPMMAFFIGIIRISSVASVIGAKEVLFTARAASTSNFRSLEALLVVAAIYVCLVLPFAYLGRRLENSQWLKRRW